ncbi:hypothetical protein [Lachnoclostridium sp.]|uniref:hypothetical protein n=1 Tax=Lachnoclostridium sp. TaxID=2028282 RepID=UPI0028A09FB8|nr:hypothetical protein [Lachnoclostridium sp.]
MHYLLKSNNLYYNLSEDSYDMTNHNYIGVSDENNLSDLLSSSTLSLDYIGTEITINEEKFRPIDKFDEFSIVCDESVNISIDGFKSCQELIIQKQDYLLDKSQIGLINQLSIQGLNGKAVFSFDSGLTWNSYANNNFIVLNNIPPNEFEASIQWNNFLEEVQNVGVDFANFNTINFNSISSETIRFAYVLQKADNDSISTINSLELHYEELAHLIKAKNSEVDIRRYSQNIHAIPKFDSNYVEIRVFTRETYNDVSEDVRVLLDAPTLIAEHIGKQVILSWNSINKADYYKVYVNGKTVYEGNDLSYTYNNAKSDRYMFAVRAYCNNPKKYIQSEFSNICVFNL